MRWKKRKELGLHKELLKTIIYEKAKKIISNKIKKLEFYNEKKYISDFELYYCKKKYISEIITKIYKKIALRIKKNECI